MSSAVCAAPAGARGDSRVYSSQPSSTPAAVFETVEDVMDAVYGTFLPPKCKPLPYLDNKGRYLWTDAFGVCNYLSMYRQTEDEK